MDVIDYSCPMCAGPGVYLGTLGILDHFKCRNCGFGFNTPTVDGGPFEEAAIDAWLERGC